MFLLPLCQDNMLININKKQRPNQNRGPKPGWVAPFNYLINKEKAAKRRGFLGAGRYNILKKYDIILQTPFEPAAQRKPKQADRPLDEERKSLGVSLGPLQG